MNIKFLLLTAVVSFSVACNDTPEGEYVDLNTGKEIEVVKDNETGYMVNADTKKPVYLYVSTVKKDTFYGRTGKKVNNHVVYEGGEYRYDDDDYVYKDGDYKVKTDDGDVKVKDGDYKMKTDDGDVKIKDGDNKTKTEKDGDSKTKIGDTKIKVDDGEVKVKKDN
jgi:hypothetical protein